MKAGEVVFQQLLNGTIQYRVPLFQRTYSWDEDQWERLWEDLLDIYSTEKPRNHFIGAVVTQPIPDAPERAAKYMLIDGQQRLTTLFLLLAVIRDKAKEKSQAWQGLHDEINETCLTNKFAALVDERLKLRPTQQDREPFEQVIVGETPPKSTQIGKAADYFRMLLDKGDADNHEIDLRKLKSCITSYLDLVSIKLEQDDSPNRIFESLNHTGVDLSDADLVRNFLFMNIPSDVQQDDSYEKHWFPMQQRLTYNGEERLSDFFWRYLMMEGGLPRQDQTYEGVKGLYDRWTPQLTVSALQQFARFSKYYCRLKELDPAEKEGPFKTQVHRLTRWEVDVAVPFLMFALDRVETGAIVEDHLIQVMAMIESFSVRRTVCRVPTNRLRRIFAQMSGHVRTGDFINSCRDFLLENEWPGDKEFREDLVRFRLYLPARLDRTRLVLESLERSFGHKETPAITPKITIEHIMPQTLTAAWETMLGPNANEVHETWLDTLGNLTLSGYNPDLSNRSFGDKKNLLESSNFALSKGLQACDAWTEQSIETRGQLLAARALTIWKR